MGVKIKISDIDLLSEAWLKADKKQSAGLLRLIDKLERLLEGAELKRYQAIIEGK